MIKLTKKKKNCLQTGLNRRPFAYEANALPLSYKGFINDSLDPQNFRELHFLAVYPKK